MKIKTLFLTLLTITLLSPTLVSAQTEAVPTVAVDPAVEQARERARERIEELRQQRDQVRQEQQEQVQDRRQEMEQTREEAQQKVEERSQEVCEAITARINNRVNQYEQNRDKWNTRYQGVQTRVTSLADTLETKGCDVTQVRTDLETFDELLTEFAATFRLFQSELQGTRAYVCSDTETDYRNQLQTSRNQLTNVKQAAAELKNFVQNTLTPHLRQAGEACTEQLSNNLEE